MLANTARADIGVNDVSQFQIRFRDDSGNSSASGLSGILRGSESQSGFAVRMLPYQSDSGEWTEISSLTSGPHLRMQSGRVTAIAAEIQKWFARHGGRGVMAEDLQFEVREGVLRVMVRGVLHSRDPNYSTSVVVSCLEGCR